MTLADLLFSPQGTTELDLKSFDCGRESVNKFFREEAQDYQDELFGVGSVNFPGLVLHWWGD